MSGGCWWVAGSRPWSLLAPSVFPYYVQGLSGETHGPAVSTHAPLLSGKRGSAERQQSRYYGSPSLRVRVTSTTSFFESEEVLTRFAGECLDAIRGNFPDGGEVNRNALLWAWLEARPAACERTEERSVLRVIGDAGGNGSRAAWPWHPCDNPYFRDAKNSRQGPRPPGGHLARRVLASGAAWWPSWPRPATSHAIESDRKIKLPLQDPGLLGGDPPHVITGFSSGLRAPGSRQQRPGPGKPDRKRARAIGILDLSDWRAGSNDDGTRPWGLTPPGPARASRRAQSRCAIRRGEGRVGDTTTRDRRCPPQVSREQVVRT